MKYSDRPNAYINAQDLEIAIVKATTYGDALKALRDAPTIDRPSGEFTEREYKQFLHGISLSLLSKRSAQHWRYDEETAQEIRWLESLEQKVRARMKGADDDV